MSDITIGETLLSLKQTDVEFERLLGLALENRERRLQQEAKEKAFMDMIEKELDKNKEGKNQVSKVKPVIEVVNKVEAPQVETVKSLRDKGYKVHVHHNRHFVPVPLGWNYTSPVPEPRYVAVKAARGGDTEVIIEKTYAGKFTSYNVQVVGISECSKHDNYNKKLGVALALERALQTLHELEGN